MLSLLDLAQRYAKTDSTILIHGESGTEKELVAQGIHNASRRAAGPFVAINFASFPESLLESELFGYEEGTFSGMRKGGKPGLFEFTHTGTIFLDEIGDMPLSLQTRLLRERREDIAALAFSIAGGRTYIDRLASSHSGKAAVLLLSRTVHEGLFCTNAFDLPGVLLSFV